ncbi:MAG: HAMP domain-containing protein, partial [Anaerolineae bacterium]|nr:HAMP domain-containing protein [Anaerolineae bacterium]
MIGVHTRNIRAQLLGNVLIVLVTILWTAFLIGSALARTNQAAVRVGEETARVNAALASGKAAAELFTAIGQGTLTRDSRVFTEEVNKARQRLDEAQKRLLESAADLPTEDPLWTELIRLRAAVLAADSWTTYLLKAAQQYHWRNIETSQMYLVPYHLEKISDAVNGVEQLTSERLMAARAEAEKARQMVRNVAIAWGAVLLVVVMGVNIALLRSLADPLERLTEASARLAAGRLETRVAIDRADEFGRLAQAFNEMADRLQTLYSEMEERVQERTRALQEANYALQRRAIQLEASAEVSRSIISIFNVDELLRRAVNLIRDRFGFY